MKTMEIEEVIKPLEKNGKKRKNKSVFLYFSTITMCVFGLGAGAMFSWTSPVLPKLKSDDLSENPLGYKIIAYQESLIASIYTLGALLTPFVTSQCADRFGRKKSLLMFAVPMATSYVVLAFARQVALYYICRAILGLGAGCMFSVIPMYVVEIAKDSNRGRLGCFIEIFISAGEVVSVVLGLFFSIRWMCLLLTLPFIVPAIVLFFFIPDTPHFKLMSHKVTSAERSLRKFRRRSHVEEELKGIREYVDGSLVQNRNFWDIFKSKALIKTVAVSIGLTFSQDMCGIILVVSFTEQIFSQTDSPIPANIAPILVSLTKLIFTCIASSIIEKSGRRILMIGSQVGMLVTLTVLGGYFYFKEHMGVDSQSQYPVFVDYLPICCTMLYMMAYGIGSGPIPWTLIGEIFPPDIKAVASPIPICFNNIFCLISAFIFPFFVESFGMALTVWFFSAMCICGLTFTVLCVPETKGKSLQEIQDGFAK